MKVLIMGAGSNLGRVAVPALIEQGHTPRLMDFRPLDTPHLPAWLGGVCNG